MKPDEIPKHILTQLPLELWIIIKHYMSRYLIQSHLQFPTEKKYLDGYAQELICGKHVHYWYNANLALITDNPYSTEHGYWFNDDVGITETYQQAWIKQNNRWVRI